VDCPYRCVFTILFRCNFGGKYCFEISICAAIVLPIKRNDATSIISKHHHLHAKDILLSSEEDLANVNVYYWILYTQNTAGVFQTLRLYVVQNQLHLNVSVRGR
jgi:hypothetical protein